jgi:transcriptional regulator with XRE-family HTH domain
MINPEVLKEARKQIGLHLRKLRIDRKISIIQLIEATGMTEKDINDIEANKRNYSIDNFLRYIQALDMYFFLSEKEGEHLNFDHMNSKANPDKAAL